MLSIWLLMCCALVAFRWANIDFLILADTDDNLRLAQVESWLGGQGWYDFATPFYAAEYSLTRSGFPKDRIEFQYYDSGHMMYIRDQDRAKLSRDVRAFIKAR